MANTRVTEGRRQKAQDFLWIVQTGLLVLAAKMRRSDPERDSSKVAKYSGTGVFIRIDQALGAACLIPDGMKAKEAAEEFCRFVAASTSSSRQEVPHWFVQASVEQHDYAIVSKADRFLWTVQTAVLADAENQASIDSKAKKQERFSPDTSVETLAHAVRVASLIPNHIDATEAASEFLAFYSPGMKERNTPPKWCRCGSD